MTDLTDKDMTNIAALEGAAAVSPGMRYRPVFAWSESITCDVLNDIGSDHALYEACAVAFYRAYDKAFDMPGVKCSG